MLNSAAVVQLINDDEVVYQGADQLGFVIFIIRERKNEEKNISLNSEKSNLCFCFYKQFRTEFL